MQIQRPGRLRSRRAPSRILSKKQQGLRQGRSPYLMVVFMENFENIQERGCKRAEERSIIVFRSFCSKLIKLTQ